ncbi:MAG: hypothetical protein AAF291_09915 [Pseudomonadota bacterium]
MQKTPITDLDTQPESHLIEKAARERQAGDDVDLLDDNRPIE